MCASKLLEGTVCEALDNFTSEVGHLNDNKWGFRQGRSTEGLLIYLTETWKKAVDHGKVVGVVFIDFQKASIPFLIPFSDINYKQWA